MTTVITGASYVWSQKAKRGFGGWAAWILVDTVPVPVKGMGSFNKECSDSDTAEVMAALNGLWLARKFGGRDILLKSNYIISVRGELWQATMARHDMQELRVRFEHINSPEDSWCDKQADFFCQHAKNDGEFHR